MGPRVFTRGNPSAPPLGLPSTPSFNGATRLHAWKHRNVAGCTPFYLLRFNGATRLHAWKRFGNPSAPRIHSRLQWGHASSRVETRESTSRKAVPSALQWGHASSRVETGVRSTGDDEASRRFNGATRLHAGKQATRMASRE